jgi:hypothetical protein
MRVTKTKNKVLAILMVLFITALLAVPIFAKPNKDIQQLKGNGKGKAMKATEFNVSSDNGTIKETKNVQSKKTEKLRHNIKMTGLLKQETESPEDIDSVKLDKVNGNMKMHVPAGQEVKEQARIKLKDISGEEIAELIADFDELTDSEKARIEKGEASLRSIRSLRLVSKEKEVQVSDSKGNKHKIKAHVDVGLNSINEDSSLQITTNNELDELVEQRYNEVATEKGLKLGNRGGVMKVDKISLKNGEEVKDAKITFKVEPEWVGEENMNNVRIMRMDDGGYTEVLPTEFTGVDDEGLLTFEGDSANGLSTFAVFMTENISQTDDTSFDWGSMKAFLLPLIIIITVGAAFVGSMMRKEHD